MMRLLAFPLRWLDQRIDLRIAAVIRSGAEREAALERSPERRPSANGPDGTVDPCAQSPIRADQAGSRP